MNDTPAAAAPVPAGPPPAPRIDSAAGWRAALDWGLQRALEAEARTLQAVDPDFAEWPLDDPAWLQPLTAFLKRPGRRFVMLAAHYDAVPLRHPRFTAWRRDWVHAMQTLQAPEEFAPGLPSLLLDDRTLLVQRLDGEAWRGRAALDGRSRWLAQERVDVVLQRASPAFAVTTLGL